MTCSLSLFLLLWMEVPRSFACPEKLCISTFLRVKLPPLPYPLRVERDGLICFPAGSPLRDRRVPAADRNALPSFAGHAVNCKSGRPPRSHIRTFCPCIPRTLDLVRSWFLAVDGQNSPLLFPRTMVDQPDGHDLSCSMTCAILPLFFPKFFF